MGSSSAPNKIRSLYHGFKILLDLDLTVFPAGHSFLPCQPCTAPALQEHVPPRPVALMFTRNAPCSLPSLRSQPHLPQNKLNLIWWGIQAGSSPKETNFKILTS